jgi:hypothetical protein
MDTSILTIWLKAAATFAALCISAAALVHTVAAFTGERNARLVEIGISVLRVDPTKEGQIAAAREWALNLIDANAGGVRFSKQDRAVLLQRQLDFEPYGYTDKFYSEPLKQEPALPKNPKQ